MINNIKQLLTRRRLLVAVIITLLVVAGTFDVMTGLDKDPPPRKRIMELLAIAVIPLSVAFVAVFYSQQQQKRDRETASEQERQARLLAHDQAEEAALQKYFDRMSRHLTRDDLRSAPPDSELRGVARVRTLTLLRRLSGTPSGLSGERKGSVLLFLYEAGLIQGEAPIIDLNRASLTYAIMTDGMLAQAQLSRANLTGAILSTTNLEDANLNQALLRQAHLASACLAKADLNAADLRRANLAAADLTEANMAQANLRGATLDRADLRSANLTDVDLTDVSLRNINYDDKTIWPAGFHPQRAAAAKSNGMPTQDNHL